MITAMQLLRSVSYGADKELKKPELIIIRSALDMPPLVQELLVERGIPTNPLPPTPPT